VLIAGNYTIPHDDRRPLIANSTFSQRLIVKDSNRMIDEVQRSRDKDLLPSMKFASIVRAMPLTIDEANIAREGRVCHDR
jgi:hypothetical protein